MRIGDEEIDPVVDVKNGYISVTDHGTGGGTSFQEIALFTARNGTVVIGVNRMCLPHHRANNARPSFNPCPRQQHRFLDHCALSDNAACADH